MDTPQLLPEHHLMALRLPTILRESEKVANLFVTASKGPSHSAGNSDRNWTRAPSFSQLDLNMYQAFGLGL